MHMYKVVVVDDEPIIVEGMTRTIDWEKWNCEVVSAAYSGQEGMDAVRKYRPNIHAWVRRFIHDCRFKIGI